MGGGTRKHVIWKAETNCAKMKCTYRLWLLIGAVCFVLVMLGVTGDVTRILDFGNPSSVSRRSEAKSGGFNLSVLAPVTHSRPQSLGDVVHYGESNKSEVILSRNQTKDHVLGMRTTLPSEHQHGIKNMRKPPQLMEGSIVNR